MPTIEDMIVVVGADTDKLRQGLAQMDAVIANSVAPAMAKLTAFDGVLAKTGITAEAALARLTPYLAAIQVGLAAIEKGLEIAGQVAERAGLGEQVEELKASWEEIKDIFSNLLPAAAEQASGLVGRFGNALAGALNVGETTDPNNGDPLGIKAKIAAATAALNEFVEEAKYKVETWGAPDKRSDATLDRQKGELEAEIAAKEKLLARQAELMDAGLDAGAAKTQALKDMALPADLLAGPLEGMARTVADLMAAGGLDGLSEQMTSLAEKAASADNVFRAVFGGLSGEVEREKAELAAVNAELEKRDGGVSKSITGSADDSIRIAERKVQLAQSTVGAQAGVAFYEQMLLEFEKQGVELKEKQLTLLQEESRRVEERIDVLRRAGVVEQIEAEAAAIETRTAATDRSVEALKREQVLESARKAIGPRQLSADETASLNAAATRAGAAEAARRFDEAMVQLDRQVEAEQRRREALDATTGATARLNAEEKIRQQLGRDLTDKERAAAAPRLERIEDNTDANRSAEFIKRLEMETQALEHRADAGARSGYRGIQAGVRQSQVQDAANRALGGNISPDDQAEIDAKAQRQATAQARINFTQGLEGLDRQVISQERQANAIEMTVGASVRLAAEERLRQLLGREMTAAEEVEANKRLDRIEAEAQRQAELKAMRDADKDVRDIQKRTEALTMSKEATAALSAEEKYLTSIKKDRQSLDENEVATMQRISANAYDAAAAYNAMSRQAELLKGTVDIAMRGMSSAFDIMTRGSSQSWQTMVESMLRDLAKLTLQQTLTKPLGDWLTQYAGSMFGAGSAGGAGGWTTTLLAGARADGGPVEAGAPYLVGERQPEIFVPRQSGSILPDVGAALARASAAMPSSAAMGGGGTTHVTVHAPVSVDATGAYPESIADIKRALAERDAALPARIVSTVAEARSRGGLR